jgi:hypothetical protein
MQIMQGVRMIGGQPWAMCSLLQEDPYVGGL